MKEDMQVSSGIKGIDGRGEGMETKGERKENMGRTSQKYIIYLYDIILNEEQYYVQLIYTKM